MAASIFGRMMELAQESTKKDIEPKIITQYPNDNSNNKVTIDLNVNFHVYHHYESTEDK